MKKTINNKRWDVAQDYELQWWSNYSDSIEWYKEFSDEIITEISPFIDINQNTLPDENNISSIVNYEKITNKLESLARYKNYNFLESLAEDSFKEIFEDKRINSVKIKIEKPDAIENAKAVGVEVFKSRSDYEGY